MDFGFAPGETEDYKKSQQERVRRMITRRADTTLIYRPGPKKNPIRTVRGFIQHLTNTASIPKPIDNVLLGGHADSEGHIFIDMFPRQPRATDFEILQDTIDTPSHSIKLDDVIDQTGTHDVHFKGCNIGRVPKFLTKFKEALGSTGVTAPKFFHGVRVDEKIGVTEFMAYEIIIRSKTAFTDRNLLIAEFRALQFERIDGTVIPDEWETWVPQNITSLGLNPAAENFQFSEAVGGEIEREFPRQFRVETNKLRPFKWEFEPSPFPPESGYLAALRASFEDSPEFTTIDFPFHERMGYEDIPDFVNGFEWIIKRGKKAKANTLFATGVRFEYTAVIPIVEPSTNHLVINFHPDNPATFDPLIQLVENDDTFFGIV